MFVRKKKKKKERKEERENETRKIRFLKKNYALFTTAMTHLKFNVSAKRKFAFPIYPSMKIAFVVVINIDFNLHVL